MTRPMLVLRPEPGARATRLRAEQMGYEALSIPLFAVAPIDWSPPDPNDFDALMLTSANAPRHAGNGLDRYRGLPAYAVGAATGRAAREAGFTVVGEGVAGVEDIHRLIERDGHGRILHLCGLHRAGAEASDSSVTHIPVYASTAIDRPEGLFEALTRHPVALLHSPRAARRLAELLPERTGIALAAISKPVAEAAGSGWERIAIAATPDDQALLEIAARLCDQNGLMENGVR